MVHVPPRPLSGSRTASSASPTGRSGEHGFFAASLRPARCIPDVVMTSRAGFLRARSVALACTVLAAGAAGCRTAAPQRVVCDVVQPSPQVAQQSPAVTTFVTERRPRLVVTPGAGTYVVLASAPVRIGSRLAWSIAYLAAADPGAATAPGADERLRFAADALFRTQQVVAEAAGAELFSVTALFGAPGEPGVSRELTYAREADGWRRSEALVPGEIPSTPPLPPRFDRSESDEGSAVDVALRFLGHVDHQEYDAAWDLSSAVVKATMSRVSFERGLRTSRAPEDGAARQEVVHSFGLGAFVPGAELEIFFARPRAIEAIQLRMDDDMEWRVAGLWTFRRLEPAPDSVTAAVAEP
jgi:hypothetical protein